MLEAISTLPPRAASDAARLQLAEGLAGARHRQSYADIVEAYFGACNRHTGLV